MKGRLPMKKISTLIILGLCSLSILTGCGSSNASGSSENSSENVSDTGKHNTSYGNLADFSCETLDGKTFTSDDLAGKDLTILNFWQTSCGPCVAEMPELESFRQTLPDNVQLILISLDNPAHIESVKDIVESKNYTGTVAMLGDGDMQKLSRHILYTPTTLFFDKDGLELGSDIVGSPKDLTSVYTEKTNAFLKDMGIEAVWNN